MTDRNLAADELTKLTANWCNTLAAGAIVAGVFAPLAQIQAPPPSQTAGWGFVISSLIYLIGGAFTHIAGRVLIELRFKS